jgi:8-hydroxy-5-deazaflavin:NADPH oxidoreductase
LYGSTQCLISNTLTGRQFANRDGQRPHHSLEAPSAILKGAQMRIAVIGSGNVGSTLGQAWARAGHEVVFGLRNEKSKPPAGGAKTASIAKAIRDSEVVVLAVPWPAIADVLKQFDNWPSKIIIDCTNPLTTGLELAQGFNISAGEQVASLAKSDKVVKAFNTTGFKNMENPKYGGKPITMFFATDDSAAQKVVELLVRDVGFEPVFAGPLKQARYLEPLAMLWISMAVKHGYGTDFAFTVVRR